MPQQNGIAKWMNMTNWKRAWCMLSNASLGKEFWAEVASIAYYIINWSPQASLDSKTLHEKLLGNLDNYSNLKFFGCPTHANVVTP